MTPDRARSYCARVTRTHYENFTVASVFLPRRLRRDFEAVYAYCRWSDDLADETGSAATDLLHWWRGELERAYVSTPRHPVMLALQQTIRKFNLPRAPFVHLLMAFQQDQVITEYDTFDQLLGYCRNSANPVGELVLRLFECASPERIQLSDEICTGLQLANFWQDVARDRLIGRIYLPREDRDRFGVGPADLTARTASPAFRDLLRFQVERTHGFLDRGTALLAQIPRELRIDIDLFLRGGRAILQAIAQQNYDVLAQRPEVNKKAKLRLLFQATAAWLGEFVNPNQWRGI
jgi:squalene synthase HpnC